MKLVKISVSHPVFTESRFLDGSQGGVGINMAGAGAVPQLGDVVFHVGILVFLMWPVPVVIGMAARTVRFI